MYLYIHLFCLANKGTERDLTCYKIYHMTTLFILGVYCIYFDYFLLHLYMYMMYLF